MTKNANELVTQETQLTSDLLIVVVLYQCSPEDSKTLKSLMQALTSNETNIKPLLVLYDNSPTSLPKESMEALHGYFVVRYINDGTNPGVSKAYNVASAIALEEDKSFLLLLDQDTLVPIHAMYRYALSVNNFPDLHLFAPMLQSGNHIYSPCRYYFKRGVFWESVTPGAHSLKHRSALNSGLLIRRTAFEKTGGFNEKVKLYFSDFEFIDRYRKYYTNFCVVEAVFLHELSDNLFKDLTKALPRFRYYAEGARESIKSISDWFVFFVTVGLRSIKLSVTFRTTGFIQIFINVFFGNRT